MTDRELLELAAKAAGLKINKAGQAMRDVSINPESASLWIIDGSTAWNPLKDSGDALDLAQSLAIPIRPNNRPDYGQTAGNVSVCRDDLTAIEALRRAITMAAAEMAERSEMRKILFLDVDGVLNSVKSCAALGGYPHDLASREGFDWIAIKLLQRLCDSSGVQIVMSSAWRAWNKPEAFAEAFDLPVVDSTPRLFGLRGEEIQAWLDANDDVEAYAILDDDSDMLESQQDRFVKTDGAEGLTWANFSKLCGLFGESPYSGAARDRDWKEREISHKQTAAHEAVFSWSKR